MRSKTYDALRRECKRVGISQQGTKAILKARLKNHKRNPVGALTMQQLKQQAQSQGLTTGRGTRTKQGLLKQMQAKQLFPKRSTQGFMFADICCGVGGASRGAIQSGYHIVGAADSNADACAAYALNVDEHVSRLDFCKNFPNWPEDLDVVWASPPCQPFSSIGIRQGLKDERSGPTKRLPAFLRKFRPKVLVMENSLGIRTVNGGRDWRVVKQGLQRAGYKIVVWPLNAADYGVCQQRARLFAICIRCDIECSGLNKPPKTGSKTASEVLKKNVKKTLLRSVHSSNYISRCNRELTIVLITVFLID